MNRPLWFKALILGLAISLIWIILTIISAPISVSYEYSLAHYIVSPLSFLLSLLGLDYFLFLISKPFLFSIYSTLFFGLISLVCIITYIGFLIDKSFAIRIKIITLILLFLIFVPLSSYTHYLKHGDNKIISHYNGGWVNIDQKMCDDLSIFNENRKPDCYLSLSRTSVINEEICNKLSGIDKVNCDNNLAKKTGDVSHCGSDPECYIFAAVRSYNVNWCESLRNNCRENCNFWVDTCIGEVALSAGDFRICGKNDNCIGLVALDKKDKTVCNYIEDSASKNKCSEDITKGLNVSRSYNIN